MALTTYFSRSITYSGGINAAYTKALGSPLVLTTGAFFCSIPVSSIPSNGAPAGTANGCIGVYKSSRDYKVLDDSAQVVFVGRSMPVAEFGEFVFTTGHVEFAVPPPGFLYCTGVGTDPVAGWTNKGDGTGTSVEDSLRAIVAAQHTGSLCCVQDARGRTYYGTLYNLNPKDTDAGWQTITFDFTQIGIN